MNNKTLLTLLMLYTSCNAMDTTGLHMQGGELYCKNKVVVNKDNKVKLKKGTYGTFYDVFKVLAIRNKLEQMCNQSNEGALKLLKRFCSEGKVVNGFAKMGTNKHEFMIFLQPGEVKNNAHTLATLISKGLVTESKHFSGYIISYLVNDVVLSSIKTDRGDITFEEPTEVFNGVKKIYGDTWRQEIKKSVRHKVMMEKK